jgi:serine/threonine-protein kinase
MSQPTLPAQPIVCPNCRQLNSPRARFYIHCGHDVILNNSGPRYFLTRVIKQGGQGAVYQAVGEDGAIYAVKEMLDTFTDPLERTAATARFAAEAATLRQIAHPRIPRVYGAFNDEGRHYLVMDLVRGEDLEEIVMREGAQPERRVLEWADELCDVLQFLHDRGVIYRDMKPSNVMREEPDGKLKLIDFGIAKVFQAQSHGTQIGTPGYAPPEQYQGLATPLSDVYALGATLHHLLSGRDPQQHPPFNYPPLRDLVPTISQRTEAAVARALQMRQEDRFQSIAELRDALRPAPAGQVIAPAAAASAPAVAPAAPAAPARMPPTTPIAAPPAPRPAPPAAQPAAPARRRGGGVLAAVVVLALIAAASVGAYLLLGRGSLADTPSAPSGSAQVLVARLFVASDIEIVVPGGSSEAAVNQSFAAAFLQLARLDCGCEPQIQEGTLVYLFDAGPRQISIGADGARYRASLQATILVPQL